MIRLCLARLSFGRRIVPGLPVTAVNAVSAQFMSECHGVPATLMTLLIDQALSFLSEDLRPSEGLMAVGHRTILMVVAQTLLLFVLALVAAALFFRVPLPLPPSARTDQIGRPFGQHHHRHIHPRPNDIRKG